MTRHENLRLRTLVIALTIVAGLPMSTRAQSPAAPQAALTRLFEDWRAFERRALRDGAPDYSAATMARKHAEPRTWQSRDGRNRAATPLRYPRHRRNIEPPRLGADRSRTRPTPTSPTC